MFINYTNDADVLASLLITKRIFHTFSIKKRVSVNNINHRSCDVIGTQWILLLLINLRFLPSYWQPPKMSHDVKWFTQELLQEIDAENLVKTYL